jgi:Flp pilus assembly pilin Flp
VEWALVVAVLVIAVVAAAYAFVPPVQSAMQGAGKQMAGLYTSGDLAP